MQIIHHHFPSLVSTNDYGKEKITTFDVETLTLVSTEEQTGGRGQYGRKWITSSDQNITVSYCFFVRENQQDSLSLTHVLAISIVEILSKYGVKAAIKWPNDIFVGTKKIAGILCETTYLPPFFGVIMGLGFNINMKEEVLKTVNQPATSLFVETKKLNDADEILKQLTVQFEKDLTLFLKEGFAPFLPTFRKLIFAKKPS